MTTILIVIHVFVSLSLILIILLQHGKGADMGATFGGSSQTVFGTEGPMPLLNKVTTAAAIVFMLTSLTLAYFSSQAGKTTVMRETRPPISEPAEQGGPATIPLPGQPNTDQPGMFPSAPREGGGQ
jgi:preprotein translocase subunit SecG